MLTLDSLFTTLLLKSGIVFSITIKMIINQPWNRFDYALTIDTQNKEPYYWSAVTNNKLGDKSKILYDLKMAAKSGHQKAIDILQRKGIDY